MQACWCSLLLLVPLAVAAQTPQLATTCLLSHRLHPAIFALRSLAEFTGPSAYQRLSYQLKALQSAQGAVSALQAGMTGLQEEQTPALGMAALFTGTKQAHDALLCLVSIIAKYAPVDETDSNTRTLLIVTYNQEAAAIADLEAHSEDRFLRSEADKTSATQVKDAERMTAISSLQSEAASTLA